MVLFKVCKLISLTLLLTFLSSCSKKEAGVRNHISNEPMTQSIQEPKTIEPFSDLLSQGRYEEALSLILSEEKLIDGEFLGSKVLLDQFQLIIDRGFNESNKLRLIEATNKHCKESFANCFVSYLSRLDNRIMSHLVKSYDFIDRKNAFLNFILSSPYNGIEKWDLVVRVLKEDKSDEASNIHQEIFITVVSQNPQYFKEVKGIESLILKYYPKTGDSWYDYLHKVLSFNLISVELEDNLIKKAYDEQVETLCSLYQVKHLRVDNSIKFDCNKSKPSLSLVLVQDIILGNFPVSPLLKESLDFEMVSNFLLYRGFVNAEKSLIFFKEYVDKELASSRLSSKFIQDFRRKAIPELSALWDGYFNDIEKISELLSIHGDEKKLNGLSREYRNFFKIAFELPYNLIFSSQLLELGHRETVKIQEGTLVIDSATVAKQLFSGRMDQIMTLFPTAERRSVIMDPLKVTWAFKAMKKYDIGSIFNKSSKEIMKVLFGQAVEEDHQRFSDIYIKYLRKREAISEFRQGCRSLDNDTMKYHFDLSEIRKSGRLKIGPGTIMADKPLRFAKAFKDLYLDDKSNYFIPELFEIYRSEFYPKSVIRDTILEEENKHELEVKISSLIGSVKEDLATFDSCFFKMREVESKITSEIVEKEIEFSKSVKTELSKLNSGEIEKSNLLEKFFGNLKNDPTWQDFFQDLPVKYGFIRTGADRFFFTDSIILQALRVSYYLRNSSYSSKYTFEYGSYRSLVDNLESSINSDSNILSYKGDSDPSEFFLNRLEENFGLLRFRESEITTMIKINNLQAAMQKIEFDSSEEENFKTFMQVANRSNNYIISYQLADWERSILEVSPLNCPSCGTAWGDKLIGPYHFLSSSVLKGEVIGNDFTWSLLDNYFHFLTSEHIGFDAKLSDYLPETSGVKVRGPRVKGGGFNREGDSTITLESFFNRESQWSTVNRVTYSAIEFNWGTIVDFGEGDLEHVVGVIKHDISLIESLRKFNSSQRGEYEFATFNFSMLHQPVTIDSFISKHLLTSYDSDMSEFHRASFNLYK